VTSAPALAWRTVAEGLAFPEGPVPLADGSVLVSEMSAGRVSRVRPDGTRTTLAETGGAPNGLAVRPDGHVVVCQGGGSGWAVRPWPFPVPGAIELLLPSGPSDDPLAPQVQLVAPDGSVSTRYTADVDGERLKKPSDVVVDDHGGVYVTDFGGLRGRTRSLAGVLYAPPDGELHEIVFPVELANGIALSPDQTELYVTETRTRRIWGFELLAPGRIGRWRTVATVPAGGPLGFGSADGCCTDAAGNIVVATIGSGGVTIFSPDGALLAAAPRDDDPMPTNVAFGGPDGTTIFVTCGSTGRLLALEGWPVPGAARPPNLV
jgi:gluconolactonase